MEEAARMNCAQFDEIVHDLDRLGSSDDLDRSGAGGSGKSEAALAHAESCSRCGRLLTEVEGLNFSLHAIASHDAQEKAPPRLEATLLRELRRQSAYGWQAHPAGHLVAKRQALRWYAAVACLVAVALLAIGLMHFRPNATPNQARHDGVISAQNSTGNGTAATTVSPAQSGATSQEQGSQNNELADSDDEAAFVRLPYADDADSLEGGAVIRVAMPRSTLASWGLPVSGIASGDRVPADVVISADGTPQAIRLVSQTNE
jgi:hypothetical protein